MTVSLHVTTESDGENRSTFGEVLGKSRVSCVLTSSSSSSKVQSSMVEYHALVTCGHVTWLSGCSNH